MSHFLTQKGEDVVLLLSQGRTAAVCAHKQLKNDQSLLITHHALAENTCQM